MTNQDNCFNLLHMVENAHKHHAFATRLKSEMDRKNKSIKDLSLSTGVTYEMARRYTLGTAKPRDEKLERIAEFLGVEPAWLEYGPLTEKGIEPAEDSFETQRSGANSNGEFTELSEDEKRLIRTFREFPPVEARNMLLAFEMRLKKLYDFYEKYASTPPPSE
ncbi:helix-turn-helix transcriptional regulator [Escherichia coli]|uniref:helix-turn-helix domain-containing protein n=1 Tax=Escherichia coli TaxID=562 RepID=UPI0015E57DFC|nr:helix-turn-helix transcriptional regulator [Escherichia coli]QLN15214.1 helix-turn-helix domain-containing protein [Escherichia coli]HDH7761448.1 helix-turn-helix domain-containing protein [Escherichia coli]